jgi:enterochelin esterase-like enzyme
VSTIDSAALGRQMAVSVFVPTTVCARPNVLVLFHGRGGNEGQWMGGSLLSPGVGVDSIAARLIADGAIEPVTIVSASIDDSYGVDSQPAKDGYAHGPYRRYIVDELLPEVVRRFGDADNTALYLGGLSMGGFVALDVALSDPASYAGVGALSPAFWISPPVDRAWMYSAVGRPSILDRAAAGAADQLPVFLGVGTADYTWIKESTTRLNADLVARTANVEMQTAPGGHETATWRTLAEPTLRYLFARGTDADC